MAVQSRADNITCNFLTRRLLQEATRGQAALSTTEDQEGESLSAFAARCSFRLSAYRGRGYGRMGGRCSARGMHGGFPGGGKG